MDAIKVLALVLVVILVASLTLTVLGRMTWRLFWMVAIAEALIAYYVLPALRSRA